MKHFRTISPHIIKECRCFFAITDRSTKLLNVKRKMKFLRKCCNSENGLWKLFADAASLECKMLVISELFMGCVDPRVGSGWVDKSAICFGDYTLQGAV